MEDSAQGRHLREVFGLFLKLGLISFGGPAAHIALMETEAVDRRRWLTREHFLELLAAVNLVPGPNATEMALYIGFVRAGWPGLVAGGAAFILPAALISGALGWVYVAYGALPQGQALFWGINPAIVAIVLVASWRLGGASFKEWQGQRAAVPGVLLVLCLAAAFLGVSQVIILLVAGLAGVLVKLRPRLAPLAFIPSLLPGVSLPLSASAVSLLSLTLFFLKVGSLLFGSGMVLFAFIQADIVERLGWLTQRELVDAIAVGQMTPGPVLSSATFIGYLLAGWPGALLGTAGVFLPSFIIMVATIPLVVRLRTFQPARAFLSGVNIAVVALILAVGAELSRAAIVDPWTALIALGSLAALLRFRPGTHWLVLGGAALGLVRFLVLRS